jgi:hypothetical protein
MREIIGMSKKNKLIKQAARWWANQLRPREAQQLDNIFRGNIAGAILFMSGENSIEPLGEKEIIKFQACLEKEIKLWLKGAHWKIKEPKFGAALRCFGTDWGPDYPLQQSAKQAGISLSFRLPLKTMMWINPDGIWIGGYQEEAVKLDEQNYSE